MRRYIPLVTAVTLALLPLTVFGVYETEPNDSWEQANVITVEESGEGYGSEAWNMDYWRIIVPADGDLSITVNGETQDIYTRLYDADGLTLLMYQWGSSATVFKNNIRAGEYFLEVNAYYYSYPTEYNFTITFTAAGMANDPEPNDTYADAILLSSGQSVEGHINFFGSGFYDTFDIYKIETDDDGRLQVTLEPDEAVFMFVTIVDGDQATTLTSANDDVFFAVETPDAAKGTYYILVNTYYTFDASGYTLGVNLYPPTYGNDTEPNDEPATAQIIAPTDITTGHVGYQLLGTRDLIDWYQVTIPYEGDLTCVLTNDRATETWITLYDTDQTTVLSSSNGMEDVTVGFTDYPAGTYYVAVNMYYMSQYCSYRIEHTYETDVVGVAENATAANTLHIFPNPADGSSALIWKDDAAAPAEIRIMNASGACILATAYSGTSAQGHMLETSTMPAGVYTVIITDTSGVTYSGRLVVMH